MSNKTQLQTNNASLDEYITRINAAKEVAASLPEAGSGGGSLETCTVTINCPNSSINSLIYVDADTGRYTQLENLNTNAINMHCVCNTHIYIDVSGSIRNILTDNVTMLIGLASMIICGLDAPSDGLASITFTTSTGGSTGEGTSGGA